MAWGRRRFVNCKPWVSDTFQEPHPSALILCTTYAHSPHHQGRTPLIPLRDQRLPGTKRLSNGQSATIGLARHLFLDGILKASRQSSPAFRPTRALFVPVARQCRDCRTNTGWDRHRRVTFIDQRSSSASTRRNGRHGVSVVPVIYRHESTTLARPPWLGLGRRRRPLPATGPARYPPVRSGGASTSTYLTRRYGGVRVDDDAAWDLPCPIMPWTAKYLCSTYESSIKHHEQAVERPRSPLLVGHKRLAKSGELRARPAPGRHPTRIADPASPRCHRQPVAWRAARATKSSARVNDPCQRNNARTAVQHLYE